MDFRKLTIFSAASLTIFFVFWTAMQDMARGESDLMAERAALIAAAISLVPLYRQALRHLALRERIWWLGGTGLMVLLFDLAALNARLHPVNRNDSEIASFVLFAGLPLLALFCRRLFRLTRSFAGSPLAHQ